MLELGWLFPLLYWNYPYPSGQSQLHHVFIPFPNLYRGLWPTRTVIPSPLLLFIYFCPPPNPSSKIDQIFFLFSNSNSPGSKKNNLPPISKWILPFLFSSLLCPDYGNSFFFSLQVQRTETRFAGVSLCSTWHLITLASIATGELFFPCVWASTE